MRSDMFDWNDLRYFVAVARHGSMLAAARALGVNQSTVQRRLSELERCLGQPLVQRLPAGYRLTEFGDALLAHAQRVEQAVGELQARVDSLRRDLSGVVRVSCPEPIVYRITQSPLLERFSARHPRLRIEFVMSDRYVDLAAGEADVALRSGDTDDGDLLGRKIADSLWAVYASRRYVEQRGAPDSIAALAAHDLIGLDESMAKHRAAAWLAQVAPQGRIVARNNSVLGLVYAAKSGVGIAPLPTALGDAEPDLVRVLGPIPELTRIWRILVHPNLRHTPRVAAFFDFIVGEREALRGILTG
ncbi:MAG TPA: LysR family transcriptional regulator [Burkholderiaceae bacterium]|jgi:DNA-binding transcriptional LysR family regulator|nr:LysR family transcriptional regulator [Burkholderiaceae bacterium]